MPDAEFSKYFVSRTNNKELKTNLRKMMGKGWFKIQFEEYINTVQHLMQLAAKIHAYL